MNIYFGIPSEDNTNFEEREACRRLIASLSALPCHARDFTMDSPYPFEAVKGTPSLIHAFNLSKSGIASFKLAQKVRLPLVVTCTGLDVYADLYNPIIRDEVHNVLEGANRIIVPFQQMAKFIQARLRVSTKFEVIAPGISSVNLELDFPPEHFGFEADDRIIMVESGLLPSKNFIFAIHQIEKIIDAYPRLKLVTFDYPYDSEHSKKVMAIANKHEWVRIIARPEPDILPFLYKTCEIFLNVSHAEGSNPFLLTAMQTGKAILGADIQGNHAYIRCEQTFPGLGNGFLYYTSPGATGYKRIHDSEDFILKLRTLLDDEAKRKELGERAANCAKAAYSTDKELYLHLQLYKSLL